MNTPTEDIKDVVLLGAGLTGLTCAFYLKKAGLNVLLIEQQNRVGGQIQSFQEKGFIYESGPNTGVVSNPEVAELFQALAPDCQLVEARKEAEIRYIWKGKKFHRLPSGILGGITTPLFTWVDKFRILGEPFRKKGTNPNESVGELAQRRLGKSFLQYAVDPFISGIYAGNPMLLTTRYALPKLYLLEQEYGGFIRGAIAKARQAKTERDKLVSKKVFTAEGGLSSLINSLAKQIGAENIHLQAQDALITPKEKLWEVAYFQNNQECKVQSKNVITTVGAYNLPDLLQFADSVCIENITALRYAPIVQVSVGLTDNYGINIQGFGGLVPSCENKAVLGILYPSSSFVGRAPSTGALLSFFLGGINHPEVIKYSDKQIEELVLTHLHSTLGFPKDVKPAHLKIFRHQRAIPQYEQNSGLRFSSVEQLEERHRGLYIAGNLKDGIGMAHRIEQATKLAKKIIAENQYR